MHSVIRVPGRGLLSSSHQPVPRHSRIPGPSAAAGWWDPAGHWRLHSIYVWRGVRANMFVSQNSPPAKISFFVLLHKGNKISNGPSLIIHGCSHQSSIVLIQNILHLCHQSVYVRRAAVDSNDFAHGSKDFGILPYIRDRNLHFAIESLPKFRAEVHQKILVRAKPPSDMRTIVPRPSKTIQWIIATCTPLLHSLHTGTRRSLGHGQNPDTLQVLETQNQPAPGDGSPLLSTCAQARQFHRRATHHLVGDENDMRSRALLFFPVVWTLL